MDKRWLKANCVDQTYSASWRTRSVIPRNWEGISIFVIGSEFIFDKLWLLVTHILSERSLNQQTWSDQDEQIQRRTDSLVLISLYLFI
jgi:hypothetical protein